MEYFTWIRSIQMDLGGELPSYSLGSAPASLCTLRAEPHL